MNGFKLIKYLNGLKLQREIMGYYNVFLLEFNPSLLSFRSAQKDNIKFEVDCIMMCSVITLWSYVFMEKRAVLDSNLRGINYVY